MKSNLELVSLDDIAEELEKRFDAFVLHGTKRTREKEDTFFAHWHGGIPTSVGLCEVLKRRLFDRLKEDDNDPDMQEKAEI